MSEYYWQKPSEQLAGNLENAHTQWLTYGTNFVAQSWVRNIVAYYSTVLTPNDWASALSFEGEQGELVRMIMPHARSLIRQTVSLVCRQRLAFKALAKTTGQSVISEARLASALVDKIVKEQDLEAKREIITENALVTGLSCFFPRWATDQGAIVAINPDNMSFLYRGDLEILTPTVFDLCFDPRINDLTKLPWLECRVIKNRHDLAAQFPHMRDKIMGLSPIRSSSDYSFSTGMLETFNDSVYVYEAYHKPTPALPQGRMIIYSSPDTVYFDDRNLYERIPIEFVRPEQIMGMGYGYAPMSNLLASQEMLDTCLSSVATNNAAFAVQNVLAPREANIGVQSLEAMNLIYYTPQNVPGGGKPEALNLTASSPETFKFSDMLYNFMTQLSSLNPAVRGTPPPGVTSGTAIATLTANSLEFLDQLSRAVDTGMERTMDLCVDIYKRFAKGGHTLVLAGRNNQAVEQEFSGKDLESIKRIDIQRVNPLMKTIAGRISMAETLLQSGLIKKPTEYFQVIEGAPTEKMYAVELSEDDLIQSENDRLMNNELVRALITDDHPAHMRCHSIILNDPSIRANPEDPRLKAALDHIMEHATLMGQQDPNITAAIRTGMMPQMGQAATVPGPVGEADVGGLIKEESKAAEPTTAEMGEIA